MNQLPQYIIGIDCSLAGTAIADHEGNLTTVKGYDGDHRLAGIYQAVKYAAVANSLAILEDLPTHGHSAGLTGMAQGVVRLALIDAGIPYVLAVPSQLKKYLLGKGGGAGTDKSDMRMEHFNRTQTDNRDNNQVDAFWLRQMGLYACGHDHIRMPKVNRETVLKMDWPQYIAARLLEPYEKAVITS